MLLGLLTAAQETAQQTAQAGGLGRALLPAAQEAGEETDAGGSRLLAAELVAKGIVLGNAVALPLCWVQQRFAIVQLDSESYSMSSVPIDLNIWIFVAVSAGTAAVCVAAMLLPAAYISKVEPAKTIKWN